MRPLRPAMPLLLAAVGVALVGCSAPTAPASSSGDPVGTWGTPAERSAHLVLETDGRLGGNDGCNGFGGAWTQAGDSAPVVFEGVIMSAMYCDGVDQWLTAGSTAIVDGDTIYVLNERGEMLGTLPRQ